MPSTYFCQTCGKEHEGLPHDIGFRRPAAYFAIPPDERKSRCKLTDDWCDIDRKDFFVRGILYVPIIDVAEQFCWGIWAKVGQQEFETYHANYSKDGSLIPPFDGNISGEPPGYPDLDGHPVRIQLGTGKDRPEFTLLPSDHILYREQQNGITLHRTAEILHAVFPNDYPDPRWPFHQPRNCATFTMRQVLDGSEPILLVSHDAEDHGWQFIGTSDATVADARIVGLEEMVRLDPTVLEVADLPPGWEATREARGEPWSRHKQPPIPDGEQ